MNLTFAAASPPAGRRYLALSILPVVLTWSLMSAANACSCLRKDTPKTFVEHATIIFDGVPVKVELVLGNYPDPRKAVQTATVRSTFLVRTIYKGDLSETVVVESKMAASLCGWQPAGVGRKQMIAANFSSGRYFTSSCGMDPISGRSADNPFIKFIHTMKPVNSKN
jgi:hypothetical protein